MAENLKALIIVLLLSASVFAACNYASRAVTLPRDFTRRAGLWLGITATLFLAHNYWVFVALTCLILLVTAPQDSNPVALFYMLVLAVPPMEVDIPGFGGINAVFRLNHVRVLELMIFFPAFLALRNSKTLEPFGRPLAEKFLFAYALLVAVIQTLLTSWSDAMRQVLYLFVDVFLPYYVTSRSIKNIQAFRDATLALVVSSLVLAAIGVFEFIKRWDVYWSLQQIFGVTWTVQGYLEREGNIRAEATTGQPIVLGYVMVVALGMWNFVKHALPRRSSSAFWFVLLLGGLTVTLSRGPWVGAVVLFFVFTATGSKPLSKLAMSSFIGLLVGGIVTLTPYGEKLLQYVPFIGSVAAENVTYRQRLIEVSLGLIRENPFFGVPDFLATPEMQSLRTGQGIIDVVNTYVGIALQYGLIGLALFVGFFASILIGIFREMRRLKGGDRELHLLARALFATLIAIIVVVGTASSVGVIAVLYWLTAGLGMAFMRVVKQESRAANKASDNFSRSARAFPS